MKEPSQATPELADTDATKSWSRIVFLLSMSFSVISAWNLLRIPGSLNPLASLFRGYSPFDQLSYAGISASARLGQLGLVEPFTQTGTSYYPSFWYKLVGVFSKLTSIEVTAAWSFLGFSAVLGSVVIVGFASWRLSGKPWAPLVVGLLLWIGPLAAIFFSNWYVTLDSHAVLWGPYGALYTLNAETAGLSLGSAAVVLGYWTISRPKWPRIAQYVVFATSALMLGLVANFQTYSFLTLTAIALWIIAIGGLLRAKSQSLSILTAGLVVMVLVTGPLIRGTIGALPVYALMLAPTIPGIWTLVKARIPLSVIGLSFFALGAAPQVIWLISGTLAKDPFLTYRVDSTENLGVPIWAFLLFGSPILLTWGALLRAQIQRRGTKETALLTGWFISFVLLSFNDLWGFNQEPYRFWINCVIVFVFVAALTLPTASMSRYFDNFSSRVLSTLAIVLVAASFWNVGSFRAYVEAQGNINLGSPQFQAIAELVQANVAGEGLITAEPCIDPRQLKVVTGAPVAFYNLGLAWPEMRTEIDAVLAAGAAGVLDSQLMREAGISYLLTDSTCGTAWNPSTQVGVSEIAAASYSTGSDSAQVSLWKID
jgi:hypothetical protein